MSRKEQLVLFDVDGTLSQPRQPIQKRILLALHHLAKEAEIGFVTGSGMEYIKEQLWPALNDPVIRDNCHLLPCNGTEYIVPFGETFDDLGYKMISREIMRKKIGDESFYKVMHKICFLQNELLQQNPYLPATGHFVQNRQSMLNWCPIGRNADIEQRAVFQTLDKTFKIREKYLEELKSFASTMNIDITIKLGGDTSFDIYPTGWDKTYALTHFDEKKWDFWFIGDRCEESGNDYELYEFLKPYRRAFKTTGPEETVDLIDWYILQDLRKRKETDE
tara:strand:+ start:24893 stop:25723 length:831 start_codon:yes stop_codon:yes gene_type:complete